MNTYEQKQQARKERLQNRATKRREEADRLHEAGHEVLSRIPFGQPILVGHHSEKADRSRRERAFNRIGKSFELRDQAKELDRRAAAVGTAGISSDDPEAVDKLTQQHSALCAAHAGMVEQNKLARSKGVEAPFPTYALSNSSANIRRIEKRIKDLKKVADMPALEHSGRTWHLYTDKDENRIVVEFTERAPAEVCQVLRRRGFLWARSRTAWVRKITPNALYAAKRLVLELDEHNI